MPQEEESSLDTLRISAPAFKEEGNIPSTFTCDGADINPEILVDELPKGTKSLVIIMDDPDAPLGVWVHWVAYNIPPKERIEEGNEPGEQGLNDFKGSGYRGPCPPSGEHQYVLKVYALNDRIDPGATPTKADVLDSMEGKILAIGRITASYKRESQLT